MIYDEYFRILISIIFCIGIWNTNILVFVKSKSNYYYCLFLLYNEVCCSNEAYYRFSYYPDDTSIVVLFPLSLLPLHFHIVIAPLISTLPILRRALRRIQLYITKRILINYQVLWKYVLNFNIYIESPRKTLYYGYHVSLPLLTSSYRITVVVHDSRVR